MTMLVKTVYGFLIAVFGVIDLSLAANWNKSKTVDAQEVRSNPITGDVPPASFWDGIYSVKFPFQMSRNSVCPKELPIEIRIEIDNYKFVGEIRNEGHPNNTHQFCDKYHNGSITGELNPDGSFKTFKIKQTDSHSRQYSSYKATGSLTEAFLVSRSSQYHPKHRFSFVTQMQLAQKLIASKAPVASSTDEKAKAEMTSEIAANASTSTSKTEVRSESVRVKEPTQIGQQPVEAQPKKLEQPTAQLALSITSSDPKEAIEEIDLKITLYAKIANNLPQTDAGYRVQQEVLDKKIEELKKARESLAASYLSKYNTPIYPVNINLGTTAFRYSEIFPSIPYYIPGTKEVGEFLVQPVVSNKGQLTYEFTFLDPSAKYNKEREQIVVVNTDMGTLIDGLDKVREWTETAEKQNVRRRFEKVASCFPKSDCGERQVGKSSTEVVFQIYENGSTSGKLQRVKGEFVSGYNMSVESTVLLGAYLKYMRDIGEQEFKVGSMTDKDLDNMFK